MGVCKRFSVSVWIRSIIICNNKQPHTKRLPTHPFICIVADSGKLACGGGYSEFAV